VCSQPAGSDVETSPKLKALYFLCGTWAPRRFCGVPASSVALVGMQQGIGGLAGAEDPHSAPLGQLVSLATWQMQRLGRLGSRREVDFINGMGKTMGELGARFDGALHLEVVDCCFRFCSPRHGFLQCGQVHAHALASKMDFNSDFSQKFGLSRGYL